jgi:DNA polymerase-3 subunit delta'
MAVDAPFATVAGQARAVAQLEAAATSPVHAYLFVGPPGSGKREAALAFAAVLLCPSGGCATCDVCRRVRTGAHPDVIVVERVGPWITVRQAEEIGRLAAMSAAEGGRRVLILDDFHLVQDAAPALLKTIEEPRPGVTFLILADHVPPELVTIASRCVRIDFDLVDDAVLVDALVAEGVSGEVASEAVGFAAGSVDRARLLAADPGVGDRRRAWTEVPARLDGTGATVATVAGELLAMISSAGGEGLAARHAAERAALEERLEVTGERGGRRELEERHRREQRRLRIDELRLGLATLEAAYRDRAAQAAASGSPAGAAEARAALEAALAVEASTRSLEHNPNESLLLEALLVRVTPR